MSDGFGLKQFMHVMGDMARGITTPSILPVWERHLLDAQDPPRVTFSHHEYDDVKAAVAVTASPFDDMVQRSFFFGPKEVAHLRRLLPLRLHNCTKIELLTACLWRCRTIAINLDPDEEVRMLCVANVHFKFNPPLPLGYYGNAIVFPAAKATVKNLCRNPLEYAVELVKQAKANVTEEYVRSVASLMVIRGKQVHFPNVIGTFLLTDLTKFGLEDVDFGWGKAVFGGQAKETGVMSSLIQTKTEKGEAGILVPICLPAPAMERFAEELNNIMKPTNLISSAM